MEQLKLTAEPPIAFHRELARVFGINGALYIQQLYYWSDKGNRSDGYIYKTKDEIEEETCLTARQQDKVRKKLVEKGLLETKLLKANNGSPTLHYKLNIPMLQNVIMECDKKYDSNVTKSNKPVTKTTTKTTTDILSKDNRLKPEYGSKEINDVFNYWTTATGYPITSNIKANRYACSNLLRKHKPEELERIINGVALAQQDKYAPRIADFRQLQAKWNEFIVWGKGRANNNKVGVVR